MRVTAETREATRQAILDSARTLFRSQGFDSTTTRDIALQAKIATGTLFNYFPTKEAIVMQMVEEGMQRAATYFPKRRREQATVEEDLFLLVSTTLRHLKPLRKFLRPTIETTFSPAAIDLPEARVQHLEQMVALLADHGFQEPPSATQLTMYWMLYVGVLSFWTSDRSPKQEDTLALLDQSVNMFAAWLRAQS